MLGRTILGLLRSYETSAEKSKDPQLRSRFFKMTRKDLFQEVVSIVKKMQGYTYLGDNFEYGEIVLEKRTATGRVMDITVTVINEPINPMLSAVDIHSASRGSLGDLGSNYRVILEIFRTLEQKLAIYRVSK